MCFNQGMGVIIMREDARETDSNAQCCGKHNEDVPELELELEVDSSLAESRLGWICPLCEMVWSPDIDSCDCCCE